MHPVRIACHELPTPLFGEVGKTAISDGDAAENYVDTGVVYPWKRNAFPTIVCIEHLLDRGLGVLFEVGIDVKLAMRSCLTSAGMKVSDCLRCTKENRRDRGSTEMPALV